MINVVLSVVVLVSVLVLVVNPGAFGKIWRSIRAKFGSWGDAVERANSVENLQQAIKDERSNIGEGKKYHLFLTTQKLPKKEIYYLQTNKTNTQPKKQGGVKMAFIL